jgi:hypothetical protein
VLLFLLDTVVLPDFREKSHQDWWILPALAIPRKDRDGLAIWRDMPDAIFDALLAGIERSPGSTPSSANLSPDDSERAMDALTTMYTIRAFNEVETEEFIGDVCEALLEYGDLRAADEAKFRERLARLLDIEALNIAAKGAALQTEHEHLFCSARVLTDARPIYGKSVSDPPAAMIITHELKLNYHEGPAGRTREFYIGLGSGDIAQLQEVLQRAEAKAHSLRTALDLSKVKFIDPQE